MNITTPYIIFDEHYDSAISGLKTFHEKTGVDKFSVVFPGNECRISTCRRPEDFRAFGKLLSRAQRDVEADGIKLGWWLAPPMTVGAADGFQAITDISGNVNPVSYCPLDPQFQEYIKSCLDAFFAECRPEFMFVDDDCNLSNHKGIKYACFCPRHLVRFNKENNLNHRREELLEIFSTDHARSVELREKWARLSAATLSEFAAVVRGRTDKKDPTIRIGLCQSGVCDLDGDFTAPLAKAFAGGTKPLVRVFGSSYGDDSPQNIPAVTFHALHTKQSLAAEFECLHEVDSYPHTRFYVSATKMRALLSVSALYGFDGAYFYACQYLDNPLEERGYLDILAKSQRWLDELRAIGMASAPVGVEIAYSPATQRMPPYSAGQNVKVNSPWVDVAGLLGIPYTTKQGTVKLIAGDTIRTYSDEQLRELLSGAVLFDGEAAAWLTGKGLADLTGVHASAQSINSLHEAVLPSPLSLSPEGELMYNNAIFSCGKEGGQCFVLAPVAEGVIQLCAFLDGNHQRLCPSFTLFENRLGGRIGVLGFNLENNRSSSIFNYRKKQVFRAALEWLAAAPLPVYAEDAPNIFCVALKNRTTGSHVFAVFNLCSDQLESIKLTFDANIVKDKKLERLTDAGVWLASPTRSSSVDGIRARLELALPLGTMRPVVVRFR